MQIMFADRFNGLKRTLLKIHLTFLGYQLAVVRSVRRQLPGRQQLVVDAFHRARRRPQNIY